MVLVSLGGGGGASVRGPDELLSHLVVVGRASHDALERDGGIGSHVATAFHDEVDDAAGQNLIRVEVGGGVGVGVRVRQG